jgi:hypothetical protein
MVNASNTIVLCYGMYYVLTVSNSMVQGTSNKMTLNGKIGGMQGKAVLIYIIPSLSERKKESNKALIEDNQPHH